MTHGGSRKVIKKRLAGIPMAISLASLNGYHNRSRGFMNQLRLARTSMAISLASLDITTNLMVVASWNSSVSQGASWKYFSLRSPEIMMDLKTPWSCCVSKKVHGNIVISNWSRFAWTEVITHSDAVVAIPKVSWAICVCTTKNNFWEHWLTDDTRTITYHKKAPKPCKT